MFDAYYYARSVSILPKFTSFSSDYYAIPENQWLK